MHGIMQTEGPSHRRPIGTKLLATLLLCAASHSPAIALPDPEDVREAPEHAVKAAFLYNFAQLVEWPSDSAQQRGESLRVGVWSDKERSRQVARVISGKQVDGRPIEVRVMDDVEALTDCQILFIPASAPKQLATILAAVRDLPILTVGEAESFSAMGGIIRLKIVESRVRFEINLESAGRSGLTVSSKLLRVAEVVGLPNEGSR